jgi:hypothetical protein
VDSRWHLSEQPGCLGYGDDLDLHDATVGPGRPAAADVGRGTARRVAGDGSSEPAEVVWHSTGEASSLVSGGYIGHSDSTRVRLGGREGRACSSLTGTRHDRGVRRVTTRRAESTGSPLEGGMVQVSASHPVDPDSTGHQVARTCASSWRYDGRLRPVKVAGLRSARPESRLGSGKAKTAPPEVLGGTRVHAVSLNARSDSSTPRLWVSRERAGCACRGMPAYPVHGRSRTGC